MRRWRIKNISDEDVHLTIRTWSGQIIHDVFHAGEVALVNDEGCAAVRRLDPMLGYFHIQLIVEEKEKVNWKEEGF